MCEKIKADFSNFKPPPGWATKRAVDKEEREPMNDNMNFLQWLNVFDEVAVRRFVAAQRARIMLGDIGLLDKNKLAAIQQAMESGVLYYPHHKGEVSNGATKTGDSTTQ